MEPTNKLGKTLLGAGLAVALGFAGMAKADPIDPTSYAMLNGEHGDFTYRDDTYVGTGDPTIDLSALSGGLGDLTDDAIAVSRWDATPGPYVGWQSIDPTITFSFDGSHAFNEVTIYVDDSNDHGGVKPPASVNITVGGNTLRAFPIVDPATGAPTSFPFDVGGDIGDTIVVEIVRQGPDDEGDPHSEGFHWIMVSEVDFDGALAIDIDIKPGSDANSIALCGVGVIRVAIFGSDDFPVSNIDIATLRLGDGTPGSGNEVKMAGKSGKELCSTQDVDLDGYDDLVCQFVTVDLALAEGGTAAMVLGSTTGGQDFVGTDSVNIVKDCN